jgi:outer membrane lipoprotein-sorting protein
MEFLTRAADGFGAVYLDCAAEYNPSLLGRAIERSVPDLQERLEQGSAVRLTAGAGALTGAPAPPFRYTWRVWWRKPAWWRDEMIENGQATVSIVRGAVRVAYSAPAQTFHTNERPEATAVGFETTIQTAAEGGPLASVDERLRFFPLLRPSFLAGGWKLSVLGEERYIGREAVRLRATLTGAEAQPGLWGYVTEYEILVDLKCGVLLRYAGIVDEEEAGVIAVRTARFDEAIPDEVFMLEPPIGTRIVLVRAT